MDKQLKISLCLTILFLLACVDIASVLLLITLAVS